MSICYEINILTLKRIYMFSIECISKENITVRSQVLIPGLCGDRCIGYRLTEENVGLFGKFR